MFTAIKTVVIIALFVEITYSEHNKTSNKDKLIFAQTICRHGDRNIYYSYPNDPWKSTDHWPGGYTQLTNKGRKDMYFLGQYLRERYESFFENGAYSPNTVYIRSTDIDRVLMSALCTMAGMFPPTAEEVWHRYLDWQPIPVHTLPHEDDYILATHKRCDRFHYFMINSLKSDEYTGLFKKFQSFINYLEVKAGKNLTTLTDINDLYDTLNIERLRGMTIPKWAEEVMIPGGDLEYLAMFYFQIYTPNTEMKRLKSGFLLKEILDRFTHKSQSVLKPDRSLWMYFAHDNTIANMLNSLGVYTIHQPPYGSCLFFELYKGDVDSPYVQVFYRNSSQYNVPPLEIPTFGTKCKLHNFYKLYEHILPTHSFEEECALRDGEILPADGNPENGAL